MNAVDCFANESFTANIFAQVRSVSGYYAESPLGIDKAECVVLWVYFKHQQHFFAEYRVILVALNVVFEIGLVGR